MDLARIMISMENDTAANKLKAILTENGYTVIESVKDGQECLRKTKVLGPDLIIVDYSLPSMNGIEIAKVVLDEKLCDILVVANDAQIEYIEDVKSETGFVCLVKPISKPTLLSTIDLMIKNRRKIVSMQKEIDSLKDMLDTRKDIERAKGLLMKHLKLPEPEAFKRIRKQSMDKGISMKEIAKAIILAYDV